MRAVSYCRVSTIEIEQLNSLNNQISHYQELLQQKGFKPVKVGMLYRKNGQKEHIEGIFADEGITGTKKKNRKAFEYMMKCAENGEFDVIFVKNAQRFARNVEDGAGDLKRLKQLDIKVIFEDGNLNYHEHEAILNMFLSIAQEESRMKSVACKFGIRKAQSEGKWTSNTPYGYNRKKGYLEVNEEEKEIVIQVYNFYVNLGWGHNKIAKYLRDNNIPTKKGGEWYQQHIKHILTNPLYRGIQTTHKSENMDVNVYKIANIPEEDWIVKEKGELKIVENDIWFKAQDIDKNRSEQCKNNHRHSDKNLLSTICICGNCGGILRRKRKRTKVKQEMVYLDSYEWVCQNNDMYGGNKCKFRNSINEDILIEFIKEKIIGYREHNEILQQTLEMYINTYYSLNTGDKISSLENQLKEVKHEYDNQIRLNSKGIISDDELLAYTNEYRRKKNEFEQKLRKIRNIDKEIEEVKRAYNDFLKFINNISFEDMSNADLKKIFANIKVGTYEMWEGKVFNDVDITINNSKYRWISPDKKTFKDISAEHLFMGLNESKIIEDSLFKQWDDEANEYYKKYGVYHWLDEENSPANYSEAIVEEVK